MRLLPDCRNGCGGEWSMSEESFRAYYEGLTDDQVLQIMADKADLVPDAAAALNSEVRKRKLKPPEPHWLRESGSDEQVKSLDDYSAYLQLNHRRKTVRRYGYLLALGPFVLGLVLGRKSLENSMTFIAFTMAWAMCVAAYGIYINFRFLAYKCPQCSERFGQGTECFSCGFPRSEAQNQK
jgi:hypothetical protein